MIYTLGNGVKVDLSISLKNSWNGGFVTEIKVKNISDVPLQQWSLDLNLASGLDVANVANSTWSQTGDALSITPTGGWLQTVSPQEEVSITFRSVGDVSDILQDVLPAAISAEGVTYQLDESEPTEGGVVSNLIVKSTWGSGAWVQVTLDNTDPQSITDWQLPITFPEGLSFASSGAVDIVDLGGGDFVLTAKKAFLNTIDAGETIAFGFNISGDVSQISNIELGSIAGAQPPAALNDTISNYNFDTATGFLSFDVADVLANDTAADGGAVTISNVYKIAGGGNAYLNGDKIVYESIAAEAGQIVVGYEVTDSDGLTDTAQVFVDLPTAPSLSVGDIVVNEATGTAQFEVTLTGTLYRDNVQVDYQTRERSALEGQDFTGETGVLNFSETNRTQTVQIDLIDNLAKEFDETFDLVLTNAKGAKIAKHAGEATIVDDASDVGPIGQTTSGLTLGASLVGEYVVGYTATVSATNTSGTTIDGNPIITVGVQDGMKLVTRADGKTEDGKATVLANHDDRYFTLEVDVTAPFLGPDLADGTFDAGDTLSFDLFYQGAHFYKPLEERLEFNPVIDPAQPVRDFVPLDLTYKGFNTTFFNRSQVSDEDISVSFNEAASIGANSTAIVTTHFADNRTANDIYANDFTMTDADLVKAIRSAKSEGLDVLLKPHLDLVDKTFRGRLNPEDEATFFGRQADGTYAEGSYGELITRYASIAQAEGVEVFLIGTELVDLAKNRANIPYWTDLINDVKAIYTGELSYATIVGEELFVRFWDQLDAISLDIYPPLTNNAAPSVGELIDGWSETPTTERGLEAYFNQPVLDLIAGMSEQYGKKVLITETGFRSVDGAAARPFDFNLNGFVDLQEQADAYEAFFTAIQEGAGEYLDGLFLWEWPNQPALADGTIEDPSDYPVNNKPAFELVDDFFDIA